MDAWTRGVMEWLCCRVSWRFSGYNCVGKSRGCWEGVAVKADALAQNAQVLCSGCELREARGVQFLLRRMAMVRAVITGEETCFTI